MAFNVLALGKLKNRFGLFKQDHPDVMPFLRSLMGSVKPGAALELKMTDARGREMAKKITLNQNDAETFQQLRNLFR